ncbi:Metallo-dependent phosphatase [Calocera cornea HHB12733]|uniref:Vacuolar protein sorting-associated protein 29 n=1 Tax=Calocera cornea HHB12733 TaxID=1353952 RepID=A0A165E616_9BASI|nr:Metallo-dependent phosphatase [Calocera cornea HHB12733]
MVLVLLIGDLHIPYRTHDLPLKFKKLLVPGKIQQILCTGNVCDRETLEYLRGIASEVHVVRGEYDDNPTFPMSLTATHGPLRIGVIHGHQSVPLGDLDALAGIARQMDVDVLVSGGTHEFVAKEFGGRFFVNPGSGTGAWAGGAESDATPSFALMDIQGSVVVTFVYQLVDGEVRVDKIEYRKPSAPAAPAPGAAGGTGTLPGVTSPKPTPPRGAESVWSAA